MECKTRQSLDDLVSVKPDFSLFLCMSLSLVVSYNVIYYISSSSLKANWIFLTLKVLSLLFRIKCFNKICVKIQRNYCVSWKIPWRLYKLFIVSRNMTFLGYHGYWSYTNLNLLIFRVIFDIFTFGWYTINDYSMVFINL